MQHEACHAVELAVTAEGPHLVRDSDNESRLYDSAMAAHIASATLSEALAARLHLRPYDTTLSVLSGTTFASATLDPWEYCMEIFEPHPAEARLKTRAGSRPHNDARARLQADVRILAREIGERHPERYLALEVSGGYVQRSLAKAGLATERQAYLAAGKQVHNVVAEVRGRALPDEILVIGTHYDTARGTPGANGSGSGVAALLELARRIAARPLARTIRFAAFATSERSLRYHAPLGSRVYAQRCRQSGDRIQAMVSLDSLGYYPLRPAALLELARRQLDDLEAREGIEIARPRGATVHPFVRHEDRRAVAFMSNLSSRRILNVAHAAFASGTSFPSCAIALPGAFPYVRASDQWSFWKEGFPGFVVTDGASLRYPHYRTAADTPEKLDYGAMAAVVAGLEMVVAELAGALLLDDLLH